MCLISLAILRRSINHTFLADWFPTILIINHTLLLPNHSEIYCHGKLLDTVQMAHIYPDSKTFVDMKMKKTPNETLSAFNDFMEQKKEAPTTAELKAWVESMFEKPGAEFEEWIPDDWIDSPRFLNNIKDLDLRGFAKNLNAVWHQLGRKMIADVGVSDCGVLVDFYNY